MASTGSKPVAVVLLVVLAATAFSGSTAASDEASSLSETEGRRILQTKPTSDQLELLRWRIDEKILPWFGPPDSCILYEWLLAVGNWVFGMINPVFQDTKKSTETGMEWIIHTPARPFRLFKYGKSTWDHLFRYVHHLRYGKVYKAPINPVYLCYLQFYQGDQGCIFKRGKNPMERMVLNFYCAYRFYEKCRLHYWGVKGGWAVPKIDVPPCRSWLGNPRTRCGRSAAAHE